MDTSPTPAPDQDRITGPYGRRFGDPLADRVSWEPARGGGANFRTRGLVRKGQGRMAFTATLMSYLFGLIFVVAGIVPMATAGSWTTEDGAPVHPIVPVLFGLLFSSVGIGTIHASAKPRTFDIELGTYWKGWGSPRGDRGRDGGCVRLRDVHALQLVSERVRGSKSSFISHELNLVLKDGSRVNVVDHGSWDRLWADAHTLGGFLDVPVWDIT